MIWECSFISKTIPSYAIPSFCNQTGQPTRFTKFLDDPPVKESFGRFHFAQLGDIWKDKVQFPPEKHVELVELMKSFELCFELPSGREYIIPELLRTNHPDFEWDNKDNLWFKYVYDFMPAGIMTRFIVLIHDLVKAHLYWKDGVVLEREKTEAQVIKVDNRVIVVRITGDDRKTLLGIIRRHMDYVHSCYANLKVDEMVPCQCNDCRENDEADFFAYKDLLKARAKGTGIQCRRSFDMVPAGRLLGEIENRPRPDSASREQEIRIFLASSAEMKEEREAIELLIGKENRRLYFQNIFLNLVIWEDLKHSFYGDRIQDYFNQKMLECEIFICMFFKKVGTFTREEFDLAYESFKDGQNPQHFYAYFKSGPVNLDEIDQEIVNILELKKEIAEAEQIFGKFKSTEDLILQLRNQLDLIVPEIAS